MIKVKTALISVYDKRGIDDFAKKLDSLGIDIFATGGTADYLKSSGVNVRYLAEITGFPEILGGKVKTLHPDIFARILATNEEAQKLNISRFDILVVNLYDPGIEPDIGGVSLIRAGIKAGDRTLVVVEPKDYNIVYLTLKNMGGIPYDLLQELNRKAARYVLKYQLENYVKYFGWDFIPIVFEVYKDLRYGTNPDRKGFLLVGGRLPDFESLKGDISLNNLYDADSAVRCALALRRILGIYSSCIVKHGSPCGAASSENPIESINLAWNSDQKSAYGGILAVSFPVIGAIAKELKGKFFDVIAAPDFDDKAIEILSAKKARLIRFGEDFVKNEVLEIKSVLGGFIYEKYSDLDEDIQENDFKPSYEFEFSQEDIRELMFSYTIARFGKSNCVAITSGFQLLGIGVGFTSRVDSAEFALKKLGEHISAHRRNGFEKFFVSSDGFFPFPDSLEVINSEIKEKFPDSQIFVAHPGGSIRDADVIKTAEKLGIKLFTTGKRCFRH